MSSLRRIGALAHLARCPCAGSVSTAGHTILDAQWAWTWAAAAAAASSHVAGFLPGSAAGLPAAISARHNSTFAVTQNPVALHPFPAANPLGPTCDSIAAATATTTTTAAPPDTLPGVLPLLPEWASSPLSPPMLHDPLLASAAALEGHQLLPVPISAATALEESLALVLSPTQLGIQLWEGAHTASGLPWWAAIPATALAVRVALLPLSLRAYAASANVKLLHQAFGLSRAVAEVLAAAAVEQDKVQQQQQQHEHQKGEEEAGKKEGKGEAGARLRDSSNNWSSSRSSSGGGGGGNDGGGGGRRARVELGQLDLVRRVFAHSRHQHGAPSFGWYLGNATVQVPLVLSLSLALRRMSDSLWPGLTEEGLLYFQDLTAPPIYLQTLSTPYGTAGAILPLALVLLYVSAADRCAGGSSPGIHTALKLLVLPLYCAALLQPHSVLLYWITHVATQLGMYGLAAGLPPLRRAAGVPESLLDPGRRAQYAEPPLEELLMALSESYTKTGNTAAAQVCLEALLARQPHHERAEKSLRALLPASAAAATSAPSASSSAASTRH